MKKKFTPNKSLILFCFIIMSVLSAQSQSVLANPAIIINNKVPHARVFAPIGVSGKTGFCGVDTVNYVYNKSTSFQGLTLMSPNATIFAQWYAAPQAMTIYGFDFYAWQAAGTSTIVSLTCKIYNSTPDSMPSGAPLRSVTVNVDSSFGGGSFSVLHKQAIFPTPVTTGSPYVITVETGSSTAVAIVANNWAASTPNGRNQWLSSIKLGNNFVRSYNITVGTAPAPVLPFNADFMMQPYVSYSITAGFTPLSCNAGGNNVVFTNTSSPVLFNPFYSVRAFQGFSYLTCMWDYGDTSGTAYTVNGTHNYNYRVPYNVRLTDTLYGWLIGCGDQITLPLTVGPAKPNANNNGPLCNGASLHLTADTIVGANYYWTGPNGYSSTQQNPIVTGVNVSMIGNYNVRAMIGQCSSLVATTYVNVITTPSANNNGPLCAGQTLNLSVTNIAGATYSWTGPNGFTSSLQSPSKTGTTVADSGEYSVYVTLSGCGMIGPYTTGAIINRVPGTPSANNNGPLCTGDNLNLTATSYPGGTYSWTGPNGFTSNQQNPSRPTVQNSFAGTYYVTISANGCASTAGSTTATINNVPVTPTAGNNGPLCGGQLLSLTASLISGATYTWSGPNGFTDSVQNPTRSSLTPSDAGNYSVIATINGCHSSAGITNVVITTLTPTPTPGSNGPLCPGQNLQLSASSISGATYHWSGPNGFTDSVQNPIINGVTLANAGIYSVTATTTGCGTSSAGNINLAINSLPSAPTAGNNGPVCNGDSLYLSASNITGASYFWNGPNGFTSSQQNPSIANMSNLKAGIYDVYVNVTGCGISSTSHTSVITHAIPATPSASSTPQVCEGDSIQFTATASGIGPTATYSWTGPNSFNSSLANPKLYNANTSNNGIYSLTVSDSGCTSQAGSTVVTIKSIPATPIPSSNSPICEGAGLQLKASSIFGATYLWRYPNGLTSNAKDPIISNASSAYNGNYTVSSIVSGCYSIPASLGVLINPLPVTPTAGNNSPKCIGDNISLSATFAAGVSYSWSGPGGYSSNQQSPVLTNVTTSMAGIYSVITVSSTCASFPGQTAVIVNTFPAAPTLSIIPSSGNACPGDSALLFANSVSGATYDWVGPAGFGSSLQSPVIRNLTSVNTGTYSATITKGGCSSQPSTISLTVNPAPNTSEITGANLVRMFSTQPYSVSGSPGSVYNWTFSGGTKQSGGSTDNITVHWDTAKSNAYVRVRETSVLGCSGALKQLDVTVYSTFGIAENTLQAGNVKLYPNPASKIVNVDFDLIHSANAKIAFVNMLGQNVLEFSRNVSQKDLLQFDISSLKAGMYFVNLMVGEEKKILKITVE